MGTAQCFPCLILVYYLCHCIRTQTRYLVRCVSWICFLSFCNFYFLNFCIGTPAVPHSWPSLALIKQGQYECGGTLITHQTIVTAAHCVKYMTNIQAVRVYLGLYNKTIPKYVFNVSSVKVVSYIFLWKSWV
jgi:hypothetical protein